MRPRGLCRGPRHAEPKIDRYEHQPRAVSNRHGERPEPKLRPWNPRENARMVPVNEPEDAKGDDQQRGGDLDLPPPFNEGQQQREREHHRKHCQQMADGQRPQRRE